MPRGKCPSCDGGFLVGDGRCARCHGTGINPQIDSAQPECPFCRGSGTCADCGGLGYQREGGDKIQTLFGDQS